MSHPVRRPHGLTPQELAQWSSTVKPHRGVVPSAPGEMLSAPPSTLLSCHHAPPPQDAERWARWGPLHRCKDHLGWEQYLVGKAGESPGDYPQDL